MGAGQYVRAALAKVREIFDYPCGQKLAPLLKTEVGTLRKFDEPVIPHDCPSVALIDIK